MKKALAALILILLLNSAFCAQATLEVSTPKSEYSPGEDVEVHVTVNVEESTQGTLIIEFIGAESEYFVPEPFEMPVELPAGESEEFIHYLPITELAPQGLYIAIAKLFDTEFGIIDEKEAHFTVVGTKENFSITIETCKDIECSEKSKVFISGETVFIDFTSDTENPTIEATLEFPDGSEKEITLPHSFTAEQEGTYTLNAKAAKEGFNDATTTAQIAAIGEKPEIGEKDFDFYVGVCEDQYWVDNPNPIGQVAKICTQEANEF